MLLVSLLFVAVINPYSFLNSNFIILYSYMYIFRDLKLLSPDTNIFTSSLLLMAYEENEITKRSSSLSIQIQ